MINFINKNYIRFMWFFIGFYFAIFVSSLHGADLTNTKSGDIVVYVMVLLQMIIVGINIITDKKD